MLGHIMTEEVIVISAFQTLSKHKICKNYNQDTVAAA